MDVGVAVHATAATMTVEVRSGPLRITVIIAAAIDTTEGIVTIVVMIIAMTIGHVIARPVVTGVVVEAVPGLVLHHGIDPGVPDVVVVTTTVIGVVVTMTIPIVGADAVQWIAIDEAQIEITVAVVIEIYVVVIGMFEVIATTGDTVHEGFCLFTIYGEYSRSTVINK